MPAGETGRVLDLIKRKYGIVGWILAYGPGATRRPRSQSGSAWMFRHPETNEGGGAPPRHRPLFVRSVADALLGNLALEQGTNFGLPVTTVPAERPDGAELSRLRPPGDGLRVDAEHRRNLGRRQ